jgi:UPF0176 protein
MQLHTAFYRFTRVANPEQAAREFEALACAHQLLGTVLFASEGINAVLAGDAEQVALFEAAFSQWPGMSQLHFKHSECKTAPFWMLKVRVKSEIVALGLGQSFEHSEHQSLAPKEWDQLMARDDVVVLDNRNSFEWRLGHFKNAADPMVNNFRDFKDLVIQNAPQWKQDNKKIAMYCTGGIRCEKTSAWMQSLGLDTFQLEGGILNYLEKTPNSKDWVGQCFVFDNRIALDQNLEQTNTTVEQVYRTDIEDERWRLKRAWRLQGQNDKTLPDLEQE